MNFGKKGDWKGKKGYFMKFFYSIEYMLILKVHWKNGLFSQSFGTIWLSTMKNKYFISNFATKTIEHKVVRPKGKWNLQKKFALLSFFHRP